MASRKLSNFLTFHAAALLVACILPLAAFAQGPLPESPSPSIEPRPTFGFRQETIPVQHKFWDTQNRVLFISAAALNGADFAVTRASLQSGGRELNPLVRGFGRSTPGLATNFIGQTAGVIGLSYFFHKTGHHKLERLVSVVNIGASVGAVSYGLALR